MRILFPAGPGYGLLLPVVPMVWGSRAAGHEVQVATTAYVTGVAAECGLPAVDVFPNRDVGADLILAARGEAPTEEGPELPPGYWSTARDLKPFELFTLAMTEGTIAAARAFAADLVVCPSDHMAGLLAAEALDLPVLEVGNLITWSTRDEGTRGAVHNDRTGLLPEDNPVVTLLRERLGLTARRSRPVARVDPRPPSLGGLPAGTRETPDARDGVPWWPMRYVPYNGGAVVPEWARRQPSQPRICVTLGTVTPLLSDGSLLATLLRVLGTMDAEIVLADHSTDPAVLGTLPPTVRTAGYLPLSGFLDTCALIVHHGGSGTTATALHHGVPQLILPEGADNPVAARKVTDLHAGLTLAPVELSGSVLDDTVRRLLDEPGFRAAARGVAAEMAAQPSPVSVIERCVAAVGSGTRGGDAEELLGLARVGG